MKVTYSSQDKLKRKINFDFSFLTNIKSLFYYALLLIVIGFLFYFLMLLENGFTLAYGGDYTAQYIPMGFHIWDYYHEIFTTGTIRMWDEAIYLGNSTIGSDAYYGLYSPFNILIIIFPREAVPYMLAITSVIKLMCAGLFFRLYLKYFNIKESLARLGGIAYAFIGWMAFYLWYNNYQDTLVFFPLVLLGIEYVIRDKKPWLLGAAIGLLTISNYVLMVSYIIAAFIYAVFRYFQTIKKRNLENNCKVILIGFLAFAGGLCLAGAILVPAFMSTLNSPKVSMSYFDVIKTYINNGEIGKALECVFSWNAARDQHGTVIPMRAYYPILNYFFPATTCRSTATLQYASWDFDDLSCSLWAYVPMMLFFIPAIIDSFKNKKVSHIIAIVLMLFSLCTPLMYYVFMGMTNAYARWTLFATTSLITYVLLFLNKFPNINKKTLHFGLAFAIIGICTAWILTSYLPQWVPDSSRGGVIHRLEYNGFDFTNIAFALLLTYVIICYFLYFFNFNKKHFYSLLITLVSIEAVLMGNFVTLGHGYDTAYNNGYSLNYELKGLLNSIKKDDKSSYRMYTSLNDGWSTENTLMNNYSSGTYFHSLYNFNVDYFTQWSRMRSDSKAVGGVYRGKVQDLDTFLGMKYYVIDTNDNRSKAKTIESIYPGNYRANVPLSYAKDDNHYSDNFMVYKDTLATDFGFSYDTVYSYNENDEDTEFSNMKVPGKNADEYYIVNNSIGYLKSAILSYKDCQEVIKLSNGAITTKNIYNDNTLHTLQISGYYSSGSAPYKIKFYKTEDTAKCYPVKDIVNIPNKLTNISYNDACEYPMQYFAFITKTDNSTFDYFDNGQSLYIKAPFSGSQKYDIYLIDENNKIFTYDDHDDHTTDNPSPIRSFYTKDKKIKAIAYCGKYGNSYDQFQIRTESGKDFFDRYNERLQYPITDVQYSADKYTFKTNYNNNRFVVSKVAYDKGWKLYATTNGKTQEVKTYNGMGGFVSFLAPTGEVSYSMEYVTPYAKTGLLLTGISFASFVISLWGYQIYIFNKKKDSYFQLR